MRWPQNVHREKVNARTLHHAASSRHELRWSPEEEAFLRKNSHLTHEQAALSLGRTRCAVEGKRQSMGLVKRPLPPIEEWLWVVRDTIRVVTVERHENRVVVFSFPEPNEKVLRKAFVDAGLGVELYETWVQERVKK